MHTTHESTDLRRSVVYLESAPSLAFPDVEPQRATLDQRNETFVPHVLAVTVGTVVDFPNSDNKYHNVFSIRGPRPFDLGRYAAGRSKSVRFDRPGIVRVFCEIHSHMSAFILVFNHRITTSPVPTDATNQPCAARPLHAGRLERRIDPRVAADCDTGRRGHGGSRLHRAIARVDPGLAHQPHLSCERGARRGLDRGGGLLREPNGDGGREAELQRGLIEAGALVDQQTATLVENFTVMARLVADSPRLKAAVDTADPPTVQPFAEEYREELHAALLVMTGRHGQLLAEAGDMELTEAAVGSLPEIQQALSGRESSGFWPHADGICT